MIFRTWTMFRKKTKPFIVPAFIILFATGVAVSDFSRTVHASGGYSFQLTAVYMSDQWTVPIPYSWGNCAFVSCSGPGDVGNQCTSHVRGLTTTCYMGDPANCGNQADSVYTCTGPVCTADPTCGGTVSTTCNTTTCSDSCGNTYPGQMSCPVCSPLWNTGCSSTSAPNSCGQTNTTSGTWDCTGTSCSAPAPSTPPDPLGYGSACNFNSCGMAGGTITCSGSCSGPTPSNALCTGCVVNAGNSCTSVPNACGMTNGTVSCTGSCTPPSNALCPVPTASLSAAQSSVPSGGSTTLTWGSTNASSCTGTGFNTGGATSGSVSTGSLTSTTNYSVNCSGATANATVTVGGGCSGAGPVTITATPTRIQSGSSSTLNWTGANLAGASCTITNASTGATVTTSAINSCNVSGSTSTGSLTNQTAYTITCAGQSATVVVNVVPKFKEF